ncbi:MAG: hypothetical protein J0G95_01100 [Rhizobiales bacterium]|nr:hypothetical protein [Hyphomicrobiales bacterium]
MQIHTAPPSTLRPAAKRFERTFRSAPVAATGHAVVPVALVLTTLLALANAGPMNWHTKYQKACTRNARKRFGLGEAYHKRDGTARTGRYASASPHISQHIFVRPSRSGVLYQERRASRVVLLLFRIAAFNEKA